MHMEKLPTCRAWVPPPFPKRKQVVLFISVCVYVCYLMHFLLLSNCFPPDLKKNPQQLKQKIDSNKKKDSNSLICQHGGKKRGVEREKRSVENTYCNALRRNLCCEVSSATFVDACLFNLVFSTCHLSCDQETVTMSKQDKKELCDVCKHDLTKFLAEEAKGVDFFDLRRCDRCNVMWCDEACAKRGGIYVHEDAIEFTCNACIRKADLASEIHYTSQDLDELKIQ